MITVPAPILPAAPTGESPSAWPILLGIALWVVIVVVHAILKARQDPR
ncbi:MAG: hypothetical protein HY509_03105 [Acidobacteria bacterium]|nr:hypothetical protein [Acidobacteriota bacterium]